MMRNVLLGDASETRPRACEWTGYAPARDHEQANAATSGGKLDSSLTWWKSWYRHARLRNCG